MTGVAVNKQIDREREQKGEMEGGRRKGKRRRERSREGGGRGRIETSRASEDSDAAGIIRNKLKVLPHAITSEPFPAVA